MAKLKWGMIGGGEGSQIGPAHRLGAQADGLFELAAGALDHRPEIGREYAQRLGIAADRAYGSWQDMLEGEKDRADRVDLVTVATPNSTHFEITKAFLEAGFNVLCEKPMTMTVEEGEEIVRVAAATGKICAVNYCYSAFPMVRQARAMVRAGEIGKVRLVVTNFSHGHHGDATDADNPRVRWRYDPKMAGVSGQFADCGIHALHMASFICDDEVERLSADFASTIASRELEDDAMVCAGPLSSPTSSSIPLLADAPKSSRRVKAVCTPKHSAYRGLPLRTPKDSPWLWPISIANWPMRSVARSAMVFPTPPMVFALWPPCTPQLPQQWTAVAGWTPARLCSVTSANPEQSGSIATVDLRGI